MKTIYKYDILIQDSFSIWLPSGAEVLTVQVQAGKPVLWAIVDPAEPLSPHGFEMRGTGHPLGEVGEYIATFQLPDMGLVFHVFHGRQEQN